MIEKISLNDKEKEKIKLLDTLVQSSNHPDKKEAILLVDQLGEKFLGGVKHCRCEYDVNNPDPFFVPASLHLVLEVATNGYKPVGSTAYMNTKPSPDAFHALWLMGIGRVVCQDSECEQEEAIVKMASDFQISIGVI
jgi:hypothetical protein